MSAAATDYLDKALMAHVYCAKPFPAPSALYVALFTKHPDNDDEVEAQGYARHPVTFTDPVKDSDGKWFVTNRSKLVFEKAAGFWGRITHYAVCDAQAGGNVLTPGRFSEATLVERNDRFEIEAGKLRVELPAPTGGA